MLSTISSLIFFLTFRFALKFFAQLSTLATKGNCEGKEEERESGGRGKNSLAAPKRMENNNNKSLQLGVLRSALLSLSLSPFRGYF
jgi:hypothetical protein